MKKILLYFLIFIIGTTKVYALDTSIKSVEIIDTNVNTLTKDIEFNEFTITPNITFNNIGDSYTFKITFEGEKLNKYKINSIKSDLEDDSIELSYNSDDNLKNPLYITMTYKKLTKDLSSNNINITVNLDSTHNYFLYIGIGVFILVTIIIICYYFNLNKIKKLYLLLLLLPISIIASENDKIIIVINTQNIVFNNTTNDEPKDTTIKDIRLNETNLNLFIGDKVKLKATISPSNINKKITWSSSNTSIAKVNASGEVTAIKEGKVVIIATVDKVKTTCNITVKKIPVQSLELDKTNLDLSIGKKIELKVRNINKTITWSSSDTSIAKVNELGEVTGIKEGKVVITATSDNSKITCNITVKKVPVQSITLDKTSFNLSIGKSVNLKATISPSNATNKTITWSSSNTNIAKVNEYGEVTGIKEGNVIITATIDNYKATCNVTVKKVPVQSIKLDKTSLNLTIGEKVKLNATISPSNATNKTITWSSSNTSIAKVNSSGEVTGIKAGNVIITATVDNSKVTCNVTVKSIPVQYITLDKINFDVVSGEEIPLTAKMYPNNATNKDITWTTSNDKIIYIAAANKNKLTTIVEGEKKVQ